MSNSLCLRGAQLFPVGIKHHAESLSGNGTVMIRELGRPFCIGVSYGVLHR